MKEQTAKSAHLSVAQVDAVLMQLFDENLSCIQFEDTFDSCHVSESVGRILAQDVIADRNLPPYDRALMDGFIVHREDYIPEKILSVSSHEIAAGRPPLPSERALPAAGSAVFISTGGVCPSGLTDSGFLLVPVEYFTQFQETESARFCFLKPRETAFEHPDFFAAYIHKEASDVTRGCVILESKSNLVIGPMESALFASIGLQEVKVRKKPQVFLCTSGEEVVFGSEAPLPWQIRGSHPAMVKAQLSGQARVLGHVHESDDLDSLSCAFKEALNCAEVVLVTGGVSKGPHDLTKDALEAIGAEICVHRVAQRPGHPLLIATVARSSAQLHSEAKTPRSVIFGLPGNPLSAAVCMARYVLPFVSALHARKWTYPRGFNLQNLLSQDVTAMNLLRPDPEFTRFVALGESGLLGAKNSGDLRSWLGALGMIEVKPNQSSTDLWYSYYPLALQWTSMQSSALSAMKV